MSALSNQFGEFLLSNTTNMSSLIESKRTKHRLKRTIFNLNELKRTGNAAKLPFGEMNWNSKGIC